MLAVGALLLTAVACSAGSPARMPATRGTPGLRSAVPSSSRGLTRPSANGLPACRAADLRASVRGRNGITGGTLIDFVVFTNVSAHDCSLVGPPAVTAVDRAGQPIKLHHVRLDGFFVRGPRAVALVADPPVRLWSRAMLPLSVSGLTNDGRECPRAQFQRIGALRVTIPGSGIVTVHVPDHGDEADLGTCTGRIRTGRFLPSTL
jgi:hypothetical protein